MEGSPGCHRHVWLFMLVALFMCTNQTFGYAGVKAERTAESVGLGTVRKWNDTLYAVIVDGATSDQAECAEYHKYNYTMQCDFIKNTDDCKIDDGFINYLQFVYCKFPQKLIPLALVFLFVWLVFLFVALGVTAEDFFCPALTAISHTMKLNQSIAGVTFLAFGNGAPDIFSAIAAISNAKNGDAGLAIGALFGAGVFVTTVVAGSIAVTRPFKLAERPFLRDVVFYLAAAFWTFTILYRGRIGTAEAIGFIGLYVGYVLVVLIGRKIYEMQKRRTNRRMTIGPETLPTNVQISVSSEYGSVNDSSHANNGNLTHSSTIHSVKGVLENTDQLAITAAMGVPAPRRVPSVSGVGPQGDNSIDDSLFTPLLAGLVRREQEPEQVEHSAFTNLLHGLNPIDSENWKNKSVIGKFYEFFKLPIQLMLQLTVPIIDYDEDNHGWNKLLNVLQIITGPMFCLIVTKLGGTVKIAGHFYLWELMLPICFLIAVVVFFTSKRDTPPVYHCVFAYLAFLVSVLWIYSVANEIVNLLQMFGVQFHLSSEVLGLTLLAWGNSIGDLVSDITVAKQGFPRMAIAACFGGPLFNMLLGIGISCTIATIKNGGEFYLTYDTLQMVLAGGLAVSLVSSLFFMLCTRFNATRIYGFYLYALYLGFLVIALLTETGIIKW